MIMVDIDRDLVEFNSNAVYALALSVDPYAGFQNLNIDCKFYYEILFADRLNGCDNFLFLNANIQSLNSKFSELKSFLDGVKKRGVEVDMICLL